MIQQDTKMSTLLLLQILIDEAREKVLEQTTFKSWKKYYRSFPNQEACRNDVRRLIAPLTDDEEVAALITNPHTPLSMNVHKDSETIDHSVNEDVQTRQDAVDWLRVDRHLVERIQEYVYGDKTSESDEEEEYDWAECDSEEEGEDVEND